MVLTIVNDIIILKLSSKVARLKRQIQFFVQNCSEKLHFGVKKIVAQIKIPRKSFSHGLQQTDRIMIHQMILIL